MTEPSPRDTLLHLTDIHFWEVVRNPLHLLNKRFLGNLNVCLRRRHEFAMDRAEPFADAMAETGIKQVLITGDFTSTATENECAMGVAFVRGLEARGLSVHLLPGNHDVYTFESVRRRRFERHFGRWLPEGGLPAVRQLAGGTPLVLVPTVCPNVLSSKGRVTDAQADAVAELIATASEPLIVAGHYPVLYRTEGYRTKGSRRLRNAGALREAMGASMQSILYISGHVHRFSYTRDDLYPHLVHLTTGAFLRNAPESDSQGEFSEIRVYEDGIKVARSIYRDEWFTVEVGPSPIDEPAPGAEGC